MKDINFIKKQIKCLVEFEDDTSIVFRGQCQQKRL